MDGSRFDAWTRRRFGLATAGALSSLLQLVERDGAGAKHNHREKAVRCRGLFQGCSLKKCKKKKVCKNRCCERVRRLVCDTVEPNTYRRCCYDYQTTCSGADGECCRDLTCGTIATLDGRRCCAKPGSACNRSSDCCDGVHCTLGYCTPAPTCLGQGEMCPEECDQGGSCAACCSGDCDANRHCA